jgi:hypothetical protein
MSKNTNLSFLTDYITADITNGRIGINNASPTVAFDVTGATKITGVLTLTSTISNGTFAYTLPSATGTLALTSSLSSYVPYTGASASVDLGTFDLTGRYLVSAGASALGGVVSMRQDAAYIPKGDGYSSIASSFVLFDFRGYTGASTYKNFALRFDGLTNNTQRIYTLPDASGTLALTSSLSGYLPLTGGTLTGALGGTSAFFSSTLSYGLEIYRNNSADSRINITNTTTTSGGDKGLMIGEIGNIGYLYNYQNGGLILGTNGLDRLTISSSGAATFSSSVTATGLIVNTSSQFTAGGTAVNSIYASGPSTFGISSSDAIYLRRYGVGEYQFQTVASGASGGNLSLQSYGGNVLIGTTTGDGYKLQIVGTSQASATFGQTYATVAAYSQWITSGGAFAMGLDGGAGTTERMRITSGGNVLVGATATGPYFDGKLSSYGASAVPAACFKNDGNGQFTMSLWNVGTGGGTQTMLQMVYGAGYGTVGNITTNGSSVSYNTTSDYRLKEDLKEIKGLDKVSAIKVYNYKWKNLNERIDGVLAHELQEVLPYAVTGIKDGEDMQGVDYSKIVPVLVKAIQELSTEINLLKQK